MGVVDTKHGVRVALEKQETPGETRYVGTLSDDEREFRVAFLVAADGAVSSAGGDAPAELTERARLIVRSALKQAQSFELPPPRRITRWRPGR